MAALREALREAQDEALGVAVLALPSPSIAAAMRARRARCSRIERHGDPRAALATARAKELLVVAPAEGSALAGLALEASDVAGARDAWEQYVAALAGAPARPWEAHARAHLTALGSRPASAAGGRKTR